MNQFICMIIVFEKTGKVFFELHIEEGTSMNHSQYHLTAFSVDAAIPNLIIIHLENSGIEYADKHDLRKCIHFMHSGQRTC